MKKYRVTVNGSLYEIEVEEMDASAVSAAPAAKAAPAPVAAAPVSAAPVSAAPAAGAQIKAPMPGNILDVKVTAGQSVKKGDVLVILEAMKMENEIQAPCDGKVTGVNVRKGDTVETQALLCTIA